MRKAIRDHRRDFFAIAALLIFALFSSGLILSQQRLTLPSWVPVLGSDHFELHARLTSAQAVTPGQGQTVDMAGIKVGDISKVDLIDGQADVTMQVDNKYAPLIHTDASFLLRPRTGLQDMTLDLDPGTEAAPRVKEGYTVPAANTAPNVQPDQILASLDGDTQAYLKLLIGGGGKALEKGRGKTLGTDLQRLEPFARDVSKINGALAKRRENIRNAITTFRAVSAELANRDTRLTDFVRSSNSVLNSFANQEGNLRSSLQELPGALTATHAALDSGQRLATTLGPAATALIPSAKALGPALRQTRPFFANTTAPIRDQIRPFTKRTSTALRHITQGSKPLAGTVKGLSGGLGELNRLFNAIAYNPPGPEEGYAFWLAWLSHNTNNLFLTQDALGPLRRGIVLQSCQTANLAEGLSAGRPVLRTLQQLTNVPASTTICPLDSTLP